MKIYDSAQKKKVVFEELSSGKVSIYVCGPTVYDIAHLGHGRSACSFDIIRRYFIYKGFDVSYISNFTDIDDKMIKRAEEEKISVKELSEKIIPEYDKDYEELGIMRPDHQPRATEFIEPMIELVEKLEEKGFTYKLEDGIYYDISKYEQYGQLSKQKLEDLEMGARIKVNEDKKNPYDFVLWKFKKEGEPFWPSKWGDGRPGWHLECSAMSHAILGQQFDIHGGGLDLKFPHHECEVAQSKGAFGQDSFAKYWMHNGFINVDNEKMSKSLGNFFTLKDIFKRYDPKVVRFMFIQTHYRNPINFSDKLLDQAKAALKRVHDLVEKVNRIEDENAPNANLDDLIEHSKEKFVSFMDDDFDTSGALGAVFEVVKEVNQLLSNGNLGRADKEKILAFLEDVDQVFQVLIPKKSTLSDKEKVEIENLIKERNQARDDKDFQKADEIRDQLVSKGIMLEDTSSGTVWKKI